MIKSFVLFSTIFVYQFFALNPVRVIVVQDNITLFTARVVQQPEDDNNFVSDKNKTVTGFSFASAHETIGLMAHNNLTGRYFDNMEIGDTAYVEYRDKIWEKFIINEIERFEAVNPDDPYSDFISVETGEKINALDLAMREYGQGGITFQTCYGQNGRLFVRGEYYSDEEPLFWKKIFLPIVIF